MAASSARQLPTCWGGAMGDVIEMNPPNPSPDYKLDFAGVVHEVVSLFTSGQLLIAPDVSPIEYLIIRSLFRDARELLREGE